MGLIDLLLPERCVGCGCEETPLCPACRAQLAVLRPPLCKRCGAPTAWPVESCRECAGRRLAFAGARSAVAYEGVARRLVGAWKDGGRRRLARIAAAVVVEALPAPSADAITFVPPVSERSLWRGHNPAEELARALADAWQLRPAALLERTSHAIPQRGLGSDERRRNVRDAFRALERPPPAVVVVDDVYTSGSTVASAAGVLRRAGADRVEGITFARTLRDRLEARGAPGRGAPS